MVDAVFIVLVLLAIKHFAADGPLQLPYQYLNKGKYGHPGGLLHASVHGVLTVLCFAPLTGLLSAVAAGAADAVVHYHVDWVKVRFSSSSWSRRVDGGLLVTSNYYFWALVADQSAHFATYAVIAAVFT